MTRQERHAPKQWAGSPGRALRPRLALAQGPERPRIPGRRPDVRVMTLERMGQQVRRSQVDGAAPVAAHRPCRADRKKTIDPHRHPRANDRLSASPEQRGRPPPDRPDGRIEQSRLRIADSGRPPNPRASQNGKWPNAEIILPIRGDVGRKHESQVVADRPRVAGVCMVDAGPFSSIQDERPRMHEQLAKANWPPARPAQPPAASRHDSKGSRRGNGHVTK